MSEPRQSDRNVGHAHGSHLNGRSDPNWRWQPQLREDVIRTAVIGTPFQARISKFLNEPQIAKLGDHGGRKLPSPPTGACRI